MVALEGIDDRSKRISARRLNPVVPSLFLPAKIHDPAPLLSAPTAWHSRQRARYHCSPMSTCCAAAVAVESWAGRVVAAASAAAPICRYITGSFATFTNSFHCGIACRNISCAFSGLTKIRVSAGVFIGYLLGLASWNWVYLNLVGSNPFWLPAKVGYAASFAIQVVVLAAAAALVIDRTPVPPHPSWPPATLFVVGRRLFIERWPAWVGGILLGLIATFTYLRTTPLGVTEETL